MRWYNNKDIPMKGEPIIGKTDDKNNRIFVGCYQSTNDSKKYYKKENQWLLTLSQDKIEWSKIKKWHYVQKFVDYVDLHKI